MYLPKVIAFNAKDPEAKKRYGVIADEMKLGGTTDERRSSCSSSTCAA